MDRRTFMAASAAAVAGGPSALASQPEQVSPGSTVTWNTRPWVAVWMIGMSTEWMVTYEAGNEESRQQALITARDLQAMEPERGVVLVASQVEFSYEPSWDSKAGAPP